MAREENTPRTKTKVFDFGDSGVLEVTLKRETLVGWNLEVYEYAFEYKFPDGRAHTTQYHFGSAHGVEMYAQGFEDGLSLLSRHVRLPRPTNPW